MESIFEPQEQQGEQKNLPSQLQMSFDWSKSWCIYLQENKNQIHKLISILDELSLVII